MSSRPWILALAILLTVAVMPAAAEGEGPVPDPEDEEEIPHILMFTRTDGFRHGSIEHGVEVVRGLAESTGAFTVTHTEDVADFTEEMFATTDIILFANTTGEHPFTDAQKQAFEDWVLAGGGFMGVHAAADTNYEWPFYQELVGAAFDSHPHTGGTGLDDIDRATVQVESPDHPIHADTVGESFELAEEYYLWQESPRGTQDVQVLLSLDESTAFGVGASGTVAAGPVYNDYGDDQPLEWVKSYRGHNRVWYTNLGHYDATWDREDWQGRFLNAVDWVYEGTHTEPEPEPAGSPVDALFVAPPGGATVGFAPNTNVMTAGAGGTLVNLDTESHNVESRLRDPITRKPVFHSAFIGGPGGTVEVVGLSSLPPGDYDYVCNIHTAMTGTVTVTEA